MASKYLIPKPEEITLLYEDGYGSCYIHPVEEDSWWGIGVVAAHAWTTGNRHNTPLIVSNSPNIKLSCSSKEATATESFDYGGSTYYVMSEYLETRNDYFTLTRNIIPQDNSIVLDAGYLSFTEAGKKLISLYLEDGGELPGGKEKYETSWIRRLIGGIWKKTFAFAHAKTVYTDFANKKTLADKLVEIDTVMGNKADSDAVPTKVSQLTNDSNYQTDAEVTDAVSAGIAKVVAGAPESLDTLKEISDWISSHKDDASAMNSAIKKNAEDISSHVSNESVHVTEEDKKKLEGIEEGANKTVVDSELSSGSTNPVQNKAVKAGIEHSIVELSMLGWSVPSECPIQNEINGTQFVQKVGRVDLGSLYYTLEGGDAGNQFKCEDVPIKALSTLYVSGYANTQITLWSNLTDKCISMHPSLPNLFRIRDDSYTNEDDFKTGMEGRFLYYELVAPITATIDGHEIGETVDDLEEKVDNLEERVITKDVQLIEDPVSDYYRSIYPISGEPYISIPDFTVQGGYSTFGPGGVVDIAGYDYTCAKKADVKFDILTPEINDSITQDGITVTYVEGTSRTLRKYYAIKGTAIDDIEIPLYSVSTPKADTLIFRTTNLRRMSSTKYYIKISDADGSNEVTIGEDGTGKETASLKTHVGKVTVYLVVKTGTKSFSQVNVKAGYSLAREIADYSPNKYSDTIDNVIDAVLDLNERLKLLEEKLQ